MPLTLCERKLTMRINTVTGPIDSSQLGKTLMHEHILIANHTMCRICPDWYNRSELIDYAVRMINRVKEHGVKTIVDMTPFQLGRDAYVLKEVAERAEINIIACSGYYWYEDVCLVDKSPEFLADIMIRDIEKGMEGSEIRPGVIKACTDRYGFSDFNLRYLKATVIAHKATGLPISTHTNCRFGRQGIGQLDYFEAEGVDLSRVLIGHMGDVFDLDYVTKVADRAGFIGLDRFGVSTHYSGFIPEDERLALAQKLIDMGYADKLVFSHDVSCFIDNLDDRSGMGNLWEYTKTYDLETHPFQFDYVDRNVLPVLMENGVSKAQIDQIMVGSPRRFFEKTL